MNIRRRQQRRSSSLLIATLLFLEGNSNDCPNPCTADQTGFAIQPNTDCKKYVSCTAGNVTYEYECFGETLFDINLSYCDYPKTTYTCPLVTCPVEGALPIENVTGESLSIIEWSVVNSTNADLCPNPCPAGFSGSMTRPGSDCKLWVICGDGIVVRENDCGELIFDANLKSCNWASSAVCDPITCPLESDATTMTESESQAVTTDIDMSESEAATTEVTVESAADTSSFNSSTALLGTSITVNNVTFVVYLTTNTMSGFSRMLQEGRDRCLNAGELQYVNGMLENYSREVYARDESAVTVSSFSMTFLDYTDESMYSDCSALKFRYDQSIVLVGVDEIDQTTVAEIIELPLASDDDRSQFTAILSASSNSGAGAGIFADATGVDEISSGVVLTTAPSPSTPITSDSPSMSPSSEYPSMQPTIRPTHAAMSPYDQYQYFRNYLEERENIITSIVLSTSNGSPSTAYTFSGFMKGLEIAVLQLPVDKAFFLGNGLIPGTEYGFVNLAAFLSNVMEEGIRIDACDEVNTDAMYGINYPLSNACGQYGRSYDEEECSGLEPLQCALDTMMETTAIGGGWTNAAGNNIPPFTCQASSGVGYPGYYDSVNNLVEEIGRTNIAGCCWWGRGALLTRGRCILGKLNAYLGVGAIESGSAVYPDADFCADPEAICKHPKTEELRWVLAMLEWTDRIQSYNNLNDAGVMKAGWNYRDQLMYFANEYYADGVIEEYYEEGVFDETFIREVVNITTRNCHDDSCWNRWNLDEKVQLFEDSRVDHFHKILTTVFDEFITHSPSTKPMTSLAPTISSPPSVSHRPTSTDTAISPPTTFISALPPNPAYRRGVYGRVANVTLAIFMLMLI